MLSYIMKITNPKSHYIKSPPSKEVMNMSCLRQSTHLIRLQEYVYTYDISLKIHVVLI